MCDLPEEAVQAAARAIGEEYVALREWDPEAFAKAALEAAAPLIAEHIASEIERVVGGYPANEETRPRENVSDFLNDAEWAARIAREAFPKRDDHV